MIKRFLRYIENLWLGMDGKPSLRSALAIAFSVSFIRNVSFAIHRWDEKRSLNDLSTVLLIEGGLICTLLGLKAYSNIQQSIIDSKQGETSKDKEGPID